MSNINSAEAASAIGDPSPVSLKRLEHLQASGQERAAAIAPATKDGAEAHFWGDFGFDGLVDEVWEERKRQLAKRGVQERRAGYDIGRWGILESQARLEYDAQGKAGTLTWASILREEFYEALAAKDDASYREELVQVMAVAASMILDLDRRGSGAPEVEAEA